MEEICTLWKKEDWKQELKNTWKEMIGKGYRLFSGYNAWNEKRIRSRIGLLLRNGIVKAGVIRTDLLIFCLGKGLEAEIECP